MIQRAQSLSFIPDRQGISWEPWNLGSRPSSTTVTVKSLALLALSRWVPLSPSVFRGAGGEVIIDGLSNSSLALLLSQHQRSAKDVHSEQRMSLGHLGSMVRITAGLTQASLPREMEPSCCFPADISERFQPSQVLLHTLIKIWFTKF